MNLWGIALLDDGAICVADSNRHCLWRVDSSSGNAEIYAGASGKGGYRDGSWDEARFRRPLGLARSESSLYLCDCDNHRIRRIRLSDREVTTVAGNGDDKERDSSTCLLTDASFSYPRGIAVREDGSILVSCWFGQKVREIKVGKHVCTLAGCLEAKFGVPSQLSVGTDDSVYVADTSVLRRISNNEVETLTTRRYSHVEGVAVDEDENVYFTGNDTIFKIAALSGETTALCGRGYSGKSDGLGAIASLDTPRQLLYDAKSGYIYFNDTAAVRKVKIAPQSFYDTALPNDLAKFVDGEDGLPQGDVIFLVAEKRLRVNAKILSVRSDYFKTMFSLSWRESSKGEVAIQDTTYESFYAVIMFLVTGRLEVRKYSDIVPDILILADRFLIATLRDFCVDYLAKRRSRRTALDYLSLADTYGFQDLRDVYVKFVAKNVEAFRRDERFANLDSQLLEEIESLSSS